MIPAAPMPSVELDRFSGGFLASPADPNLLFRSFPDTEASLRAAGRL